MKAAAFRYARPTSTDEAVAVLAEHGDEARPLAGGQSLLAMMNLRLARPEVLVDIGRCSLEGITLNGSLEIGATTTQNNARASDAVRSAAPLLAHALGYVGHHALRNRGTIGGSAAHADPAAEIPAVLTALQGEVIAVGPSGTRTIHADDLFVSAYMTSLADDELLTTVRLPSNPPAAWAFGELARRHGDFPIAGVAAAFDLSPNGEVRDSRLVLFGVGERPLRVLEAESALRDQHLTDPDAIAAAAAAARAAADPVGDVHGSAAYRKRMTEVVVRRAMEDVVIDQRGAE